MSTPNFRLTTPDLVVLSLLIEKEQHGYELNAELERREVADWAGVSRPQVYYSLKKLLRQRFIQPVSPLSAALGPERQVYRMTALGQSAFTEALEREGWANQRVPHPFLTWLALSPHISRETARRMIERREAFLQDKINTEHQHLPIVQAEPTPIAQIAELMVFYSISECEQELAWLAKVRVVLLSE